MTMWPTRKSIWGRSSFWGALVVCAVVSTPAAAQLADAAAAPSAEELAKQLSNPVASLISVPFQNNWDFEVGPEEQTRYLMNFQPVMPFSLNEDWNLIARVILPILSQPPLVTGAETTFGFGDFVTSFFLSPTKGSLIWGVGPVLLVPAGSDPFLGSGKWGAGPTAVVLKQFGPWTAGALVNHIWSYGGDDERNPVNQTFLQPFVTYSTKTGYSFGLNTEASANWEAASGQQWTVATPRWSVGYAIGLELPGRGLPPLLRRGSFAVRTPPRSASPCRARSGAGRTGPTTCALSRGAGRLPTRARRSGPAAGRALLPS